MKHSFQSPNHRGVDCNRAALSPRSTASCLSVP